MDSLNNFQWKKKHVGQKYKHEFTQYYAVDGILFVTLGKHQFKHS